MGVKEKKESEMKNIGFFPLLLFASIFFSICFPVFAIRIEEQSPSISVIVEEAAESLVRITVPVFSGKMPLDVNFHTGTGFVINRGHEQVNRKTVITAFHVIRKLKSETPVYISNKAGERLSFKRITHLSASDDLAVLEIEGYEGPSLELGTLPSSFELITLCTFWAAFKLTSLCDNNYTLGFLPRDDLTIMEGKLVQTDSREKEILVINGTNTVSLSGLSGGPMINDQGDVVGVAHRTNMGGYSEDGTIYIRGTSIDALRALLDQPELPLNTPENLIEEEIVILRTLSAQGDMKARLMLFLLWKLDNEI